MSMVSVAEVQSAGVTIEAEEAVAIAQQLIAVLRDGQKADVAAPPYGPPTPENVYLAADGAVICRACETTPAVSEMAILLQAMLRAESVRVPGGLRYAMARALLDVDVPPFDSLDDFSETLARYERGPRRQIVRRLLQRLDSRRAVAPVSIADRRRHPHATPLRRALREADARLYLQKVATDGIAVTIVPHPAPPPRRRAAAACVAAGLLLIVVGESIDGWHRSTTATVAAPAASLIARDVPLSPNERRTANLEPRARNPEPRTPNSESRTSRVERPSTKRAVRVQPARERVRAPSSSSRGVLDRLRLNWLRAVFRSS
jgi:hypothetical protein